VTTAVATGLQRTSADLDVPAASFNATFRSWSPRLTVAWQASPALMPYLNIARGQSPGTFNPVVPTTPGGSPDESYRDVDEEVAKVYPWVKELSGGIASGHPRRRTVGKEEAAAN